MFYDVHCHLTDKAFDTDRNEVINECKKKNISIILNGLNLEDNKKVLGLSKKFDNVFASIGFHPSYEFNNDFFTQVKKNKDNIVAIGEVGLDKTYGNFDAQLKFFKKVMKLAEEVGKPLIIHSRKAQNEVLDVIKDVKVPVILHAFLTSKKLVKKASEMSNVYFSISSIAEYSEQVQDMIKQIDISKLLCETDSPYMWKQGRNTPLNVIKAYETIAKIKGLSLKMVEKLIESNIRRII